MMSIQNLVLFCQLVIKKKQILTSIKGPNSVADLRKPKIYNTNVDLVNDNVYTKFGLNLSNRSQDNQQKPNSDVNQGTQLCCKFAKKNDLCTSHLYPRLPRGRGFRGHSGAQVQGFNLR